MVTPPPPAATALSPVTLNSVPPQTCADAAQQPDLWLGKQDATSERSEAC